MLYTLSRSLKSVHNAEELCPQKYGPQRSGWINVEGTICVRFCILPASTFLPHLVTVVICICITSGQCFYLSHNLLVALVAST
jgi:hypothetical protein